MSFGRTEGAIEKQERRIGGTEDGLAEKPYPALAGFGARPKGDGRVKDRSTKARGNPLLRGLLVEADQNSAELVEAEI